MYSVLFVAILAALLVYRSIAGSQRLRRVEVPVEANARRRYLRKIQR